MEEVPGVVPGETILHDRFAVAARFFVGLQDENLRSCGIGIGGLLPYRVGKGEPRDPRSNH